MSHTLVLAVLVAVGLMGACNKHAVKLLREPPREVSRFRWVDARAQELRSSGFESIFIMSCAYGAYRMGDENFTPSAVALLRSDLDAALGAEFAGKTLKLKTYLVHFNRALELREQVAALNSTSLIGALVSTGINDSSVHGCGAEDLRGSYLAHEVKNRFSPIIVVIELEVNGKLVHTRWVESPSSPIADPDETSETWNGWVTRVLHAATQKLIANLKALQPATPAPTVATQP